MDADGDGQVSLGEWRAAGRALGTFGEYDRDGDGLITPRELFTRPEANGTLVVGKGPLAHSAEVGTADDAHRGKTAYKVLTVRLEAGKTYRFETTSAAFQSFLYLEDADGGPLAEGGAPGVGETCRLSYRPSLTGTYRLVLTSVGGFRDGPCTLTVREGVPRPGVPRWFEELDTDADGQVSLGEWRAGGRAIADFNAYDLNGDGLITPQELPPPPPKKEPRDRAPVARPPGG